MPYAPFTSKWVASPITLFCLPQAGSGSAVYTAWKPQPAFLVEPVALPGRDHRFGDAMPNSMPGLIAEILPQVTAVIPGPYALFGHSMGAHIAFELAREIRRIGLPAPRALLVSAARAPHLAPLPPIGGLENDALLRAIAQRYGLQVTPEMAEIIQLTLPTLRADIQLMETHPYRAEPPLDIPLVAFTGSSDPGCPIGDVRQWESHTLETFTLKIFPGGHDFIQKAQALVLNSLSETLAALSGD